MSATLLSNAEQQFFDSNGKPLAGGSVYFYIPNTTTYKNTWQDSAQTILNTNPVILDAAGRAIIWGNGTYRQVVYDQFGNLVWDRITQDSSGGFLGNMTDAKYVAGTDFTPGTTKSLTLPAAPGAMANLWVFFDAAFQADDQIASLDGTTLTFANPIPDGVQEVNVKIGSTAPIGAPSNGSVTDATVAVGAGINASKLSFLQKGTGAKVRTVLSKLQDRVCVKDFGAVGDGSTDDTAAFNAAATYATTITGGCAIYVPAGNYSLSGPIAWDGANSMVSWEGDGSNQTALIWTRTSGGNGFIAGASTPVARVAIRGMTLVQNSVASSGAAIVVYGAGSTPMSFVGEDITAFGGSVGGTPSAGYWGGGAVSLYNPTYPRLKDIYFFGIGGNPSVSSNNLINAAYTITADNGKGAFMANFKNCFANGCNQAWSLVSNSNPGIEGVFFDSCNAVSVNTAVVIASNAGGGYLPPQYVLEKCQFEFLNIGISATSIDKLTVSDSLFYDQGSVQTAAVGILCTNCTNTKVHDCDIIAQPGNTGMAAVTISGTSSGALIHDLAVNTPHAAVATFDSASRVRAYGIQQSGAGQIFQNSSSSPTNFGNVTVNNPGKHWSPSGVAEKFGSTVVTTDAAGNFTVSYDEAFPNAALTVVACNGDSGTSILPVIVTQSGVTTSGFSGKFQGATSAATVRVNWIAKGY
jgi:hypothetical protein